MSTSERVHDALLAAKGGFVSGEELASGLSLSRAAVWKAVSALEREGVEVEAVRGRGYRIAGPEPYNATGLARHMKIPFTYHETTETTMADARRLLAEGHEPPFCVIAGEQTGGRGRRGRSFSSGEGGIYLSVVVPSPGLSGVEAVTTAAAVGVAKAIDSLGFDTKIKWVNDIFVGERKVVGILCEGVVSMEDGGVADVVIGIGVNYTTKDFPPELGGIAGSLFPVGNAPVGRAEFASRMVDSVLESLSDPGYITTYRKKCFVIGREVTVIRAGKERPAKAVALDDHAHLVVRYGDGSEEALSSGEVSVRPLGG